MQRKRYAPRPARVQYPLVGDTAIIPNVAVPNFKLWTVGQGNLYTVTVVEGALNDSIMVRDAAAALTGSPPRPCHLPPPHRPPPVAQIRSGVRVVGVDPATSRLTINGQVGMRRCRGAVPAGWLTWLACACVCVSACAGRQTAGFQPPHHVARHRRRRHSRSGGHRPGPAAGRERQLRPRGPLPAGTGVWGGGGG
jgi:hypothetical protein